MVQPVQCRAFEPSSKPSRTQPASLRTEPSGEERATKYSGHDVEVEHVIAKGPSGINRCI